MTDYAAVYRDPNAPPGRLKFLRLPVTDDEVEQSEAVRNANAHVSSLAVQLAALQAVVSPSPAQIQQMADLQIQIDVASVLRVQGARRYVYNRIGRLRALGHYPNHYETDYYPFTANYYMPFVQFSKGAQDGAEDAAGVGTRFTVTLTVAVDDGDPRGWIEGVTVPLTYSGTATRNTDYTAPSSVTIPAGSRIATFEVIMSADITPEADEIILITANQPTNAFLGRCKNHQITVGNND